MNNKITDIKISVIIPVYNGEAYLRNYIESILNQKVKEIEAIIGKWKEKIITTKCTELKINWFICRNIYKN